MSDEVYSPLKRFFRSRSFLGILFVILALMLLNIGKGFVADYHVKQEISTLKQEVQHLQKKKLESMEVLKYVTSQAFVEEKARTELNLKTQGEQLMMVNEPLISQENTADRTEQGITSASHPLDNPSKWWYYFTHT